MTPLQAWQRMFSMDRIRLPLVPHELNIICTDSCSRCVSHVGIELMNCVFNSDALQAVRRLAPANGSASPTNAPMIDVRYTRASVAHIWVKCPNSNEYIKVPNVDEERHCMSAHQVSVLARHARKDVGSIARSANVDARARLQDIAAQGLHHKNQAERRRARKLLGLSEQDETVDSRRLPPVRQAKPTQKARERGKDVSTIARIPAPLERTPPVTTLPPRFEFHDVETSSAHRGRS